MKLVLPLLLLPALLLTSCERSVDTPVDRDLARPYLHDLQMFPESFNTDTILVGGGTNPGDILHLSFDCIVIADRVTGNPTPTIRYTVGLPAEESVFAEGVLKDDGISPDLSANDGIFAGKVSFAIQRVNIGRFEVAINGFYDPASPSNLVRRSFDIFRSSQAPVIAGLVAPDTVILPGPGQVTLLLITLGASDPDGLGDLREVFFRNLDSPSDTTRKFFLLDDGHVTGVSGDSVANDGTFSIIVQLPAGTPAATYRFLFEATDRSGLGSNTILHPLTVLNPE
jgi:hypothetical protein